jgi:spermidine/putrescine transport system substrate-binding protein
MSRSPRRPLSPPAAAVVRALRTGRLSRREVLGAAGALGVGAALSACGTGSSSSGGATSAAPSSASASGPSPAADTSATSKQVRWANWTLYLDYDEESKKYPTLEKFKAESGLEATYAEDVDDNETYYGKVQAQLRQGQDIGKDVIVLTDWMAARLVKAGWTQKLNQANIPNGKNILPTLKGATNLAWDPGRDYSYTWQSGYAGLAWNVAELQKLTGKTELKTLDDLWDPKLKGRIEVLSEMRDTVGLILMSQGVDITSGLDSTKWEKALEVLEAQLGSGQIRQVRGNSYKEDMISKDAVAVIGWSGDIFQLNTEARGKDTSLTADPYGFAVPESGGTLWSDNLLVPVGSPHKTNAEKLIDFYYDPAIAAEVAAYVNYICPVQGAQEEILKIKDVDPAVAKSPYIFPSAEDLAKVKIFGSLDAKTEQEFTTSFQKVLGV